MDETATEDLSALRQRLSELEETLAAILGGNVDALVVDGPGGKQVFTLTGAEGPYRIMVERMQEGALTLADDGTIVYGNHAFAKLVNQKLERIVGKSLADFVAPEQDPSILDLLTLARREATRREIILKYGDTGRNPAIISLSPLQSGEVEAFTAIISDLSEQRRIDHMAAAERFARSVLEQATEAVIVCDTGGRIMQMSRAAERLLPGARIGGSFAECFGLVIDQNPLSPRPVATSIEELVRKSLKGASLHGIEVSPPEKREDGDHFLFSSGPLYDSGGSCTGCIITLTDISEKKQAETRQKHLIDELNHRVKNTLAAVQSIAMQTRRTTAEPADFHKAFTSRLHALARAHDLLTRQSWQGAALMDVAWQTLAPFTGGRSERITIEGPFVRLSPNAALTISMGLHELATNAVKYGALSNPQGRVILRWDIDSLRPEPAVHIRWDEKDGPEVRAPSRRGFGTRLIETGIAGELAGGVEFDFAASGLVCLARLPLSSKVRLQ